MSRIFRRVWRATIGDWQTAELRVSFKASKTLEKEPNNLDLKVYNGSDDSRAKLVGAGVPVILEAGYEGSMGVIFSGQSRTIDNTHEVADWVTHAQCGDGEQAYQFASMNESFGPGTRVADVIRSAVGKLGVSKGNLEEALSKGLDLEQFSHGFVGFGRAGDILDKAIKAAGLTWSVQQGAVQVLKKGEPLQESAFILSADTGLLGSPDHAPPDKKTKRAILKCKSFLNPQIKPGSIIRLDTLAVKGDFICQKVDHSGDSHGNDWVTSIEAIAKR